MDSGCCGWLIVGNRDPKKFLEALRRNPQLTREEYAFVKEHATLVREAGIFVQRGAKVTYKGDLVDGVALMGGTANTLAMTNTQVDVGRVYADYRRRKAHGRWCSWAQISKTGFSRRRTRLGRRCRSTGGRLK